MNLSVEDVRKLGQAAMLHDIGKMFIPVRVLDKRGDLSPTEIEIIKRHPKYGADLISQEIDSPEIIYGVLHHHERWNGRGYPGRLKGEAIPFFSRIIAVADAFDAMTNPRPYRVHNLRPSEALSEIEIHAGTQFDPEICRVICKGGSNQEWNNSRATAAKNQCRDRS